MADRIGVVEAGRLVQLGTPRDIYRDPSSTYVATRLGSPAINLLPRDHFPDLALPDQAVTLGIRPEHIAVRHAQGRTPDGRIRRIEPLGDQSHLHIEMRGAALVTLVDHEVDLGEGDGVVVELMQPLLFDAAGRRVRQLQEASR